MLAFPGTSFCIRLGLCAFTCRRYGVRLHYAGDPTSMSSHIDPLVPGSNATYHTGKRFIQFKNGRICRFRDATVLEEGLGTFGLHRIIERYPKMSSVAQDGKLQIWVAVKHRTEVLPSLMAGLSESSRVGFQPAAIQPRAVSSP